MATPTEKVTNESRWKLINARCVQLTDSISNARTPFLLALVWSFIWAWALYNGDYSYLKFFKARYERLSILSSSSAPSDQKQLEGLCPNVVPGVYKPVAELPMDHADADTKLEICKSKIKSTLDWASKEAQELSWVSFPGGFAKLHISDLGIVGQTGLLLLLAWSFFAVRRENHSFKAIVDMTDNVKKSARLLPTRFELAPTDPFMSAQHLSYAYHAVAQRFLFIFSSHSAPLLGVTVLLCSLPLLVAGWNVFTDLRDLSQSKMVYRPEAVRVTIELVLFVFVCLLTHASIRLVVSTSLLLNGWYLAVRDVWMNEWDERTNAKASYVVVDLVMQKATQIDADARK